MNKFVTGLIITLIVTLVVMGTAITAARLNLHTINRLTSVNKELIDSLHTYKNKYGEEVVKRAAAEANTKLLVDTYSDKFDWIKQHMGVQEKNVKGIFSVVTNGSYSGGGILDTLLVEHDILSLGYQEHDPWMDFTAEIKLEPSKGPQLRWDLETRDSVTLVPYKEGKNTYVKGISANPHSKIKGLQGILVATDPKNKRWGIGPSIQIGYDTQVRITPGISVQYSLIRF